MDSPANLANCQTYSRIIHFLSIPSLPPSADQIQKTASVEGVGVQEPILIRCDGASK